MASDYVILTAVEYIHRKHEYKLDVDKNRVYVPVFHHSGMEKTSAWVDVADIERVHKALEDRKPHPRNMTGGTIESVPCEVRNTFPTTEGTMMTKSERGEL